MQRLAYQALRIALLLGLGLMGLSSVQAGPYDQSVSGATAWLSAHQNPDGSWGDNPGIQAIYTSVAVQALANAHLRQGAYFAGLTWLENHAANNIDAIARQANALAGHGDSLGMALTYLQSTQKTATANTGWGLSSNYASSPMDTALALQAVTSLGNRTLAQPAIDYLKASQLTTSGDQGWPLSSGSTSDLAVTALVVQALAKYQATDPSLTAAVTNALNTLSTKISSTSPALIQSLAAQAAQAAGNTNLTSTFLSRLNASQAQDGSWANAEPFTTALATLAFATANSTPGQDDTVNITDQALRRAINLALGRNAGDSLNKAELGQLTSLSAVGAGISDLTGLENASNLRTLDLRNNSITSTAPLNGLQLTTLKLDGNPVSPNSDPVPIPALPVFAQIALAVVLMWLMSVRQGEFQTTRLKTVSGFCAVRPLKPKTIQAITLLILLGLLSVALSVHAEQPGAFSPAELKGMQAASQGVLAAKQTYRQGSAPGLAELREQLGDLRQLLKNMLDSENLLTIHTSPVTTSSSQLASASLTPDDEKVLWRTQHAGLIAQARTKLSAMKSGMKTMAGNSTISANNLYQQMPHALEGRLSEIEREIEGLERLPLNKRSDNIQALVKALAFENTPFGLRSPTDNPDRPTLKTRTGHRILPKATAVQK